MIKPVVKGATYVLAHVPDMVRYGSKPEREIQKDPTVLARILGSLRGYSDAVEYAPNQVFVGNARPESLYDLERPWTGTRVAGADRFGPWGEILSEEEFYGWLKIADVFDLVSLDSRFVSETVAPRLSGHPLIDSRDLGRIGTGTGISEIEDKIDRGVALPLYDRAQTIVGCVERGHDEDRYLVPQILLENLSNKASGIVALRHVLRSFEVTGEDIEYSIACDEDAVGDRYQRGGGNMGKSIAEHAGCVHASGADVKAFCCGPGHAITIAAALVQSGLYQNVAVVGGGSLAKLGMKFAGSLRHEMPVTEDQIAAFAVVVGVDDGANPVIRLDAVGRHEIAAGASAQEIYNSLVVSPLERFGCRIVDIDKYAVELHNPDITEPNGNGNVPRGNYRIIASMAVMRGEMERSGIEGFERTHGMPGFSPTQGHIASAVPFLGFAREMILKGEIQNSMFVAKGSMFLGKMTRLSDGISFIVTDNQ